MKQEELNILPQELERLQKMCRYEESARQEGFSLIAGVDEAGRGPLAGPVVATACLLPEGLFLSGIDDSKKLTPKRRAELFASITSNPEILYGIGVVDHETIDQINILQATIQAMLTAVEKLEASVDFLLVDGLQLPHPSIPVQKIVRGDSLSQSIAAASILAKETRDRLMCEYHERWPEYGFAQHKGYGTRRHLEAIAEHGPCPIHRMTFAPLSSQV